MDLIEGLSFAAPVMLLVAVLFLPALVRELRRPSSRRALPLTGLEFVRTRIAGSVSRKPAARAAVLAVLVGMLTLIWARPEVETRQFLSFGAAQARQKNILLAIDVSRSMAGPMVTLDRSARFATYGEAQEADDPARSRFAVARDTVYRFVDRFPDARIGLILFSTEPFLARWPTVETGHRFIEVLEEDLHELSQLRRFSSLTNTDAALELAGEIFAKLESADGGAVIHISDAEDELENMGVAIRALRSTGIRLYTFGVGISRSTADELSREFAGDPGFRIFRVDSEADMQEAYRLVAELEESPRYAAGETAYVTDLRWLLALALAALAVVAFWTNEIVRPRALIRHSVSRRLE